MKFSLLRKFAALCGIAVAAALVFAVPGFAQKGGNSLSAYAAVPQAATPPPAAKINPKEQKDYKELYAATDSDKKIQLGTAFLQKYPSSTYVEPVYNQLVNAYNVKQDWPDLFAAGDKVIAIDPDDVDVLALEGWVLSRLYKATDPDAQAKLDKSEKYEKHVIELVPNLAKPAGSTEDDFAKAKAEKLDEAHSALGVDYFRAQDFDNAAKELQMATQGNPSPDQTDFYVLGIVNVQLKHFSDAVDAFQKCTQLTGSLAAPCKDQLDDAKKQVK
jgi:tetratricopeptide (TPR) repeat protein